MYTMDLHVCIRSLVWYICIYGKQICVKSMGLVRVHMYYWKCVDLHGSTRIVRSGTFIHVHVIIGVAYMEFEDRSTCNYLDWQIYMDRSMYM